MWLLKVQLVTGYNVLLTHYSTIKKVLEDHYNTFNTKPRNAQLKWTYFQTLIIVSFLFFDIAGLCHLDLVERFTLEELFCEAEKRAVRGDPSIAPFLDDKGRSSKGLHYRVLNIH